ncbi:MAG: DUF6338 family protein [Actinomycetota bacterium]
MINTFEAVAVTLIALIPGATYVWAVERRVGQWGAGLPDMLLRYLGTSAALHILLAPLTYWLWSQYAATGVLRDGRPVPWALWGYLTIYLATPFLLGSLRGIARDWPVIKALTTIKSPTGWDHLFGREPQGWIKMKTKSGAWIGGWFGKASGTEAFAGGYPHPRELYVPKTVEVDQASGKFVVDERGRPYELGPGMLVRWDEVEYLKFSEVNA